MVGSNKSDLTSILHEARGLTAGVYAPSTVGSGGNPGFSSSMVTNAFSAYSSSSAGSMAHAAGASLMNASASGASSGVAQVRRTIDQIELHSRRLAQSSDPSGQFGSEAGFMSGSALGAGGSFHQQQQQRHQQQQQQQQHLQQHQHHHQQHGNGSLYGSMSSSRSGFDFAGEIARGAAGDMTHMMSSADAKAMRTGGGAGGVSSLERQRAHLLLATRGVDPDRIRAALDKVDLRTTLEPLDPVADTDVPSFLRHAREMAVVAAVEESRAHSRAAFRGHAARRAQDAWAGRRGKLLEALGRTNMSWRRNDNLAMLGHQHQSHNQSAFGASFDAAGLSSSLIASPGGRSMANFGTPRAAGGRTPLRSTPGGPDYSSHKLNLSQHQRSGRDLDNPNGSVHNANMTASQMSSKMLEYSRAVAELNAHRARGDPHAFATALRDVSQRVDDRAAVKAEIADCYEAIAVMVGEGTSAAAPVESAHASSNAGALVPGACLFLERQYDRYMQRVIQENPEEARLGPRPGLAYRVRAFMNVRLRSRGGGGGGAWPADIDEGVLVDGAPLWPQLYYCLRCGDVDAALGIARAAPSSAGDIASFLDDYARNPEGRTLPRAAWSKAVAAYNQFSRGPADPFKLAVYNILARCDIECALPTVFATTQDFLWYRLRLVTEDVPAGLSAHAYPLADFQSMLREYGATHFNRDGRTPLLYFQVLLLSAQPEAAVHFLATAGGWDIEAVHTALCLSYYGAISEPVSPLAEILSIASSSTSTSTSTSISSSLPSSMSSGAAGGLGNTASTFPNNSNNNNANTTSSGITSLERLNVARLVRQYVRHFSAGEPREAVQYLILLRDSAVRDESLRDLALQTGEFDTLFGSNTTYDTARRGFLSTLLPRADVERIARATAEQCESDGRYEPAVRLFDLISDHDRVVDILNRQLSLALASAPSSAGRAEFRALADRVATDYAARDTFSRVRDTSKPTTLRLLLSLMTFFDLCAAGKHRDAAEVVESLGVLPLEDSRALAEEKARAFMRLDERVRRAFGDVVLAYMTLLHEEYSRAKGAAESQERMARMAAIRAKSAAVVTFCGMINFYITGDANARIIRLHVLIN